MFNAFIIALSSFVTPKILRYTGYFFGALQAGILGFRSVNTGILLLSLIYFVVSCFGAVDLRLHIFACIETLMSIIIGIALARSKFINHKVIGTTIFFFFLHFLFSYISGFGSGYYKGIYGNRNLSAYTLEIFYMLFLLKPSKRRLVNVIVYIVVTILVYYSQSRKIQVVHVFVSVYLIYQYFPLLVKRGLLGGTVVILPFIFGVINENKIDSEDKNELLRLYIVGEAIDEISRSPFSKRGLNNSKYYVNTQNSPYTTKQIDSQSGHLELMLGIGLDGWLLYWFFIIKTFRGKNRSLNILFFLSLFWIDATLITHMRINGWVLLGANMCRYD